ncbi:glycoside hydrolase 15 protein [Ceratobasidium sp. 428]|nr:glycoside hydrolase 15 protein [Ceratobasidium sp. 428]
MRHTYTINNNRSETSAIAIGRFDKDTYVGGNPWYIATFAAAEQLYDAVYQWRRVGKITITSLSLPFFQQLRSSTRAGTFKRGSEEFEELVASVVKYADEFSLINKKYIPADGSMSEQFDRETGEPTSAFRLSASYASAMTAFDRRRGYVPAPWGASEMNVPSVCKPGPREEDLSLGDVFKEPPRPATPPPTFTTYHRKPRISQLPSTYEWSSLDLQLVGHHVLWAQHLWNAAIVLADFLDARSADLCQDKRVLELGAGGALPSLVAALCGARQVVITDYPDGPLIDNIKRNVDRNIRDDMRPAISVEGYVWGTDPQKLLGSTGSASTRHAEGEAGARVQSGFDVIILSDLIFNHSQVCTACPKFVPGART